MSPNKNLIHKAILYQQTDEVDADGNVIFKQGQCIPCLVITKKNWNPGSGDGMGPVSYLGADIAIPGNVKAMEGDKLVYQNRRYIVEFVNTWIRKSQKQPPLNTIKCRDYGQAEHGEGL